VVLGLRLPRLESEFIGCRGRREVGHGEGYWGQKRGPCPRGVCAEERRWVQRGVCAEERRWGAAWQRVGREGEGAREWAVRRREVSLGLPRS